MDTEITEPEVNNEEFWYFSILRDANEVIMNPLYGAQRFIDDLPEEARNQLRKVINNK